MPTLAPDTLLVHNPAQPACVIDDEVMVMNASRGLYFGLDDIGSAIWNLLQTPRTPAQIRDHLLERYDVTAERCEHDVVAYLERLLAEDLIRLAAEG